MNSPIQKVVVLGASSAGLLATIALKHYFPQLQISLVYSPKHSPIGVGESTTAWVPQFLHHCLKIPRREFYKAVQPVWKLGIRFEWGQPHIPHFNYTFDPQFAYDTQKLSRTPGFYSLHQMQNASRFSILMDKGHAPFWVNQKQRQVQLIQNGFGYHFGLPELHHYLWSKVQGLDVELFPLEVLGAHRNKQGDITSLICEEDKLIDGDLFIDCSGFQSQLLKKVLDEPFISYGDRLFCDSAVVGHWQRQESINPFTTVTTMKSGWRWRIDLRDRVSFGYVFSSQFCSAEEAIKELQIAVPNLDTALKTISFQSGRFQRFWVHNVIAIGNAAGFVEPLESTGQHMIAESIWRVILALIDSNLSPSRQLVSITNQYMAILWDEICDFLSLHFKFNHKISSPFWDYCHVNSNLGTLQNLVDLYQQHGVCRALSHYVSPSSLFEIEGYLSLICGQKINVHGLVPLTSSELEEWKQYRQQLIESITSSISVRKAFELFDADASIQ